MSSTFAVRENTVAKYTATLKDENGTVIPLADLSALTLTLYDKETGQLINRPENQNVLNTNDVTYHATSGLLTWIMKQADNPILDRRRTIETHIALFKWTFSSGSKGGNHHVQLDVLNVTKVP